MKNCTRLALITLTTLTLGAGLAQAREVKFSVEEWAQQVKKSVTDKNSKEISRLLDLKTIEAKALERADSADRRAMEKARELYAQDKFNEAIAAYDQVSKDSDFWLEAVEEKAWSYIRLNEMNKALAQTKTLMSPVFNSVVGTEPFFLQSLANLKICDYKAVLETHKLFKESQRARIKEMQNLADHGTSATVDSAVSKINTIPVRISDLGNDVKLMPRLFYRDREFLKDALRIKMADAVLPALRDNSGDKTIAKAIAQLESNQKTARADLQARVKVLAQRETNENFKMLQKINLLEVETIQRVHIDQGADKKAYAKSEGTKAGAYDLVFEDDGHPWIDELDKYQVQTNACPQNTRRKM